MPDHTGTKIPPRLLAFMGVVMFLFGGTAGYIVRDVRADEQVLRAASDARESAQSLASEALQRGQLAAGTLTAGVRVAAESTAAAVDRLTDQPKNAQAVDSAKGANPPKANALGSKSEQAAADSQPARPKR